MLISEFLPNPAGRDADGEFIELVNESVEAVNLAGWKIKDESGKTFTIRNTVVEPGEYVVLPHSLTKISLNNNRETLFLYDIKGALVSTAHFNAAEHNALAGESLVSEGNRFSFTDHLTPGAPNILSRSITKESGTKRTQEMIAQSDFLGGGDAQRTIMGTHNEINIIILGICVGLACALIYMILFKSLVSQNKEIQ